MAWAAVLLVALACDAEADEAGLGAEEADAGASTPEVLAPVEGADRDDAAPDLGGPEAVAQQLFDDGTLKRSLFRNTLLDRSLRPWFAWKRRLNERYGLNFGLNYTSLVQGATGAPPGTETSAAGGALRLLGVWTLVRPTVKDAGGLVFSVENRHRYTAIAPADLGVEVGYAGLTGTAFGDFDVALGDLNWQQSFNCGRSAFLVGRYTPVAFFDTLGYANPWTTFQNAAILLNLTNPLPDQSTGVWFGHWITPQWYGSLGLLDADADLLDADLVPSFAGFYKTAEIGWAFSKEEKFRKKFHVNVWHVDSRTDDDVPEDYGVAVGGIWSFGKSWSVFGRASWSAGNLSIYDRSATAGCIYDLPGRSDAVGLGVNWGGSSTPGLRDQYTTELFYRLQLTEHVAATPSLQWLHDPALTSATDDIVVFGLRVRLDL